MKMGDSDHKMAVENEAQKASVETKVPKKVETERKEVEKAKVSVDMHGIETAEGSENAEITSGEVSEKTQKTKDQYNGASGAGNQSQAIKSQLQPLPPPAVMKKQVKRALKKEIKDLHKKINRVMSKQGNLEADQLNKLMANLRKLKEMLAALAHATSEFVKDLWMRFVKDDKS